MRTRFLLPNSMPLPVHLCLAVAPALLLLLLLSSPTSCLGTQYQDCLQDTFICGGFNFSYPFGKIGSGCGEPDFQLQSCEPNSPPRINISRNRYRILEFSSLDYTMTIVDDNMWDGKCKISQYDYSELWWSNPYFKILPEYSNIMLFKYCNKIHDNYRSPDENLNLCGDDWYYRLSPEVDPSLTPAAPFCMVFQLPIKKIYQSIDNLTLLKEEQNHGFGISWHVDQNIYERCRVCQESKGSCGYSTSEPFLCYCSDETSHRHKCTSDGGPNKSIIIGCSIGGAALIAIAVLLFFMFYVKRRNTLSRDVASGDMEAAILPRRQLSNLPIFSYEELRQATNCFREENELGDGGFGSVYLGKLSDGRTVAVKRLYQDNSRRLEQFINEVQIFSTLNHPRVVRLYGCTPAESPELLLVYEFVSNGTLADHLHGDRRGPRGLQWDARLNIAIQTAEALDFLHSVDPPIFHRDVKSTNILLDENLNVKVADFGLCRLVPVNASHVTTAPQGTPGYVDPEYHQCYQLTEKSDVYSFGVVLVEIISAKLAVDINRNRKEISLANMAKSKIQEGALNELVDPQLGIEMNHEVKVTVSAVAELALRCLASERDYRPHMKEVVAELREIKQSWDTSTGPGDQQWGSFSNTKESLSPISVQDKWSSKSSTPNASA